VGDVVLDVSVSLDGYTAGPEPTESVPIGVGGDRLHEWMFRPGAEKHADRQILTDLIARVGAVLIGRRTFDLGLPNWGDVPFPAPGFVLTHRARADLPMATGTFCFVTDGLGDAVRRARAAAGDRDVAVMGGDVARQCLAAGLIDEMHLHVVPVLLGRGVRLFEDPATGPIDWEVAQVAQSPWVTHVRYRRPAAAARATVVSG
jgi:dihydrofolate reductase